MRTLKKDNLALFEAIKDAKNTVYVLQCTVYNVVKLRCSVCEQQLGDSQKLTSKEERIANNHLRKFTQEKR